jgi:hypothetical protein
MVTRVILYRQPDEGFPFIVVDRYEDAAKAIRMARRMGRPGLYVIRGDGDKPPDPEGGCDFAIAPPFKPVAERPQTKPDPTAGTRIYSLAPRG